MTTREEFIEDLNNLINAEMMGNFTVFDEFLDRWAPKDIEDKMQKAIQEISKNHHKIIDDWCKAYLAEFYQEGIELKPGSFSLIEQQDFVLENGKMAKKYWFEPINPKEKEKKETYGT